jgi:hypothetical protein
MWGSTWGLKRGKRYVVKARFMSRLGVNRWLALSAKSAEGAGRQRCAHMTWERMIRKGALLVAASAVTLLLVGCSSSASPTEIDPTAVPAEISALIDNWSEALAREDGSVLELYVPEGYHLYGDLRIEHDSIPAHLSTPGYTHEWTTPTPLITNEGYGRYVAVRGTRNTSSLGSWASALLFEIVETPDDGLRLAQTAWFYDSEWSP